MNNNERFYNTVVTATPPPTMRSYSHTLIRPTVTGTSNFYTEINSVVIPRKGFKGKKKILR